MTTMLTRRLFLQSTALGAAQLALRPTTRAADLNGKLRVAAVGPGNKGRDDLEQISASPRVEVAALCNIDHSHAHFGWAAERFTAAQRFADYRKLLDHADSFDAVIVSTPDHMHAPIALAAMELGKHVFCQKPLTHTVREAREMRLAASRYGAVTQMGNQIQSHHIYRRAVALVREGAIGNVREVHSWQSGRMPWRLVDERPKGADPIPKTVHWDLWLGVAPERPYKQNLYHPFNWRAWQDFSAGQLGDFGCHILDPIFKSLDLSAPIALRAEAPPINGEVWAPRCKVMYKFPGNSRTTGDVLPLTWYDGEGHKPDRDAFDLPKDYRLPGAGSVVVGEEGTLVVPHMGEPQLFPQEKFADYDVSQLGDVNHYLSWVDACLGTGETTSSFDYAGPLTETVLLGAVAIFYSGEELEWDAPGLRIQNHPSATDRLTKSYRSGWGMDRFSL